MKNRTSLCTLFFLFLFLSTSFAGNNFIGWYAGEWGGSGTAVIQTQDGAFAVTGNTSYCENSGYCTMGYVTKLSPDGTVLWSTVIGDADNDSTYMTHLTETSDGGIAAAGYTAAGSISDVDMLVVKFDATGKIAWQRVYGQELLRPYPHRIYDNGDNTLTVLTQIVKPGCYDCGCTMSTMTQVTINSQTGAPVGEQGLSSSGIGYKVSTGFIALPVVFYNSIIGRTVTVQKFNDSGLLEWSKAYSAKDSQGNRIQLLGSPSLAELSDGYLVNARGSEGLLYQFKINTQGVVQWMKSIKVYEDSAHSPTGITVTADGYGLISIRNGYSTVENIIIKTNSADGSVSWAKKYGNTDELFNFISPTSSGFAATGSGVNSWYWLQLGVFDTNGLIGETCDLFTISDVSATVTPSEYFVEQHPEAEYCAYPNLISANTSLVYASNTFAQKEFCSGTIDIPGIMDTSSYGNDPDADKSGDVTLNGLPVSTCNEAMGRAYLYFDISEYPEDVEEVVIGVTHLPHDTYCYSNCEADFYFYPVLEAWQDNTLNYNNMPQEGEAALGPIPISFPNNFETKEYNITDLYRKWKSGELENNGVSIHSPTVGCNNAAAMFVIHSSEAEDVAQRPYITVKGITTSLPDSIQSYLVLTDTSDPLTLSLGDYVQLFGSTGINTINMETGARVQCLNFIGSNQINVKEASSEFTVYRLGATVYLNSLDGTRVKLAATLTPQTLRFADGSSELVIDGNSVFLGNQIVIGTEAQLDAPLDGTDTSENIF